MEIFIRVESQTDDEALASLYDWLAADPEAGRLDIGLVARSPADGKMTLGLDLINVVISNAISLTSLLVAISTWRRSHVSAPPKASIERNGVSVSVDDSSHAKAENIFDQFSDEAASPKADDRETG